MSMDKIRLAIADDHHVLTDGYTSLLKNHSKIKILFTVDNGKKLLEQLKIQMVDVVMLDIEMPVMDGMATLKEIRKRHENIKVIIITTFYHNSFMVAYAKAGANAFLPKTCMFNEVEKTILEVYKNTDYFSIEVSEVLARNAAIEEEEANASPDPSSLTEIELKIIKLVCDQKTSQQISDELVMPKRRIDYYRQRIMQKLNCNNISALVLYAVNNKLI